MVKVAFYKGKGTWMNAIIRWWTRGPYSHTEVILSEVAGTYLCYSSHSPDGGIRGKWRRLHLDDWDIVEVDADPGVVEKWYLDRKGCKYDWWGLIGFAFRPDDYDRNKYFCSEANAASLGINQAWRLSPNGLKPIIDKLSKMKENRNG